MKDPLAVFSAEWLAKAFDMDVIILTRHPAAFAGSLKVANWPHPFDHFLRQPLLMNGPLAAYRAQIEEFTREDRDIVDHAILLWNLIHHVIRNYRHAHPDWVFVRHEDISADPVHTFRMIFERLRLSYTPAVEKVIRSSSQGGAIDLNRRLVRNSRENIFAWQKRLTSGEIRRIRDGTRDIADEIYANSDWGED